MTQLKPHSHYRFSEIIEALISIGKRDLCECLGNEWSEIAEFYLAPPEKNDYLNDWFDREDLDKAKADIAELIAALRSFGITEEKILVVSFD